ncbi:DUF4192 domain-containing protein [Nocardia takedensis]|uniref:DUF4192 domain-containing protein n=1 Tax=Nocardia TaxID=1817 RepID=UPI0024541DB3|nr:DUF4192 domain-containing protein [Nocardia abscessus]
MSIPQPLPSPGRLIASIPGMIGFIPQRSLILVLIPAGSTDPDRGELAALPRFDLTDSAASIIDCLRPVLATTGSATGFVIVVDDRLPAPGLSGRATSGRDHRLVEQVVRGLAASPVRVSGTFATVAIVAGGSWWSLSGTTESGTLPDPARTPSARQRAALGMPVLESRAALADSLRTDPALAVPVSAALGGAVAEVRGRRQAVEHELEMTVRDRHDLEQVLYAIADLADGVTFPPSDLARLGAVLSIATVSQCLPAIAIGEHAVAAERLWILLTRSLTGRYRAEAAVLLAYSAHLRGDGTLAGLAITIALEADPTHIFARLLNAALERALPPGVVHRFARFAIAAAADLGITIP